MEITDVTYYVPDIKLVGYGRSQMFQCVCLKCGHLYFNLHQIKSPEDLFCSYCEYSLALIPDSNKSFTNYVGNIVGWEVKSTTEFKQKRSFYNYKKVYLRDCYQCQYCGYSLRNTAEFKALHIDHLKPWSAGGSNKLDNLVVACATCNLYASNKWFSSFYDKKKYLNEKNPPIPNVVWEFISIEGS